MAKKTQITGAPWQVIGGVQVYLTGDGVFEIKVKDVVHSGRDLKKLLDDLNAREDGVPAMRVRRNEPCAVKHVAVINVTRPQGRYYDRYRLKDNTVLDVSYSEAVFVYDKAAAEELERLHVEYQGVLRRWQQTVERLTELTADRFKTGIHAARPAEEAT